MQSKLFNAFKGLMFLLLMLAVQVSATSSAASDSDYIRLSDHVPNNAINDAVFLSSMESDTEMQVTFVLPLRNQQKLQDLINRLYDPADPQYGKYLSSAEFVEQFSPTQEDYETVIAYAQSIGLAIRDVHPNRTLLNVSGAARDIESAFNLRLNHYMLPHGRQFYAPNKDPEVPASISLIVNGIVGLDNHAQWHPQHIIKDVVDASDVSSQATASPSGPGGGFAPADIVKAYNLSSVPTTGANQTVALFELAGYQTSDVNFYTQFFNLPAAKLQNVIVDGGSQDTDNLEVALDIQLALAIAPNCTVYVYEGPNSGQGVLDTYNRIVTDNLAKQVSTSWGLGENFDSSQTLQAESAIFQQMAAQGQTIYSAAGDHGAYDDYPDMTLVVDDPASQPYVVGVGGTHLTVNSTTGAYQGESVWNDGPGSAGGGGVSTVWPIPSWQANISTAYSQTHRNVPDVTLNGDPNTGYSVYFQGQWIIVGGTSCAAPLWAAFTALVNQQLAAATQPVLGFANPKFYTIGKGATYTTNFNDITMGDNLFYKASMGYDNASGWGSFNGANLFASLTNSMMLPISVQVTSPANGATVSGTVTFSATVSDSVPVSQVTFYVDSTVQQTVSTAPYQTSVDTTKLANGQHTLKVVAQDSAGNTAQQSISVTVQNQTNKPTVHITSPANGATVSGTVTFSATVSDSVPVSQVTFYVDSTVQQTVSTAPYQTSVDTTKLANGQHTLKVVAQDSAGNTAQQSISVNVQNQTNKPTVHITSPTNGSTISGTINFSATVSDSVPVSQVAFYVDSTVQQTLSAPPYQTSVDTTKLANGSHVLKVVAQDSAGNTAQQSVSVNVQNQTNKPTVAITYPTPNVYVGGTIFVTINASSPQGIARVELLLDCQVWGVDTSSPYVFPINTFYLSQGQHTVTAVAYDNAGNFNQTSVTFYVQN